MPLRTNADTDGATYILVKNLSGLMTEQRLFPLSCPFLILWKVVAIDKLLTNNPMAAERFADSFDIDFCDMDAIYILKAARDLIHQGHKLYTHPVTSGTAPNGNPFMSIVLSLEAGTTDFDSVSIIESAIMIYTKLGSARELPETAAKDFMLINCEMLAKDSKYTKHSDKEGTI